MYDTSCCEYSFGVLEAHTTIFEFRNSNVAPNGLFCNGRNAVLDVSGLISGVFVFLAMFGVLWCFLCLLVYDTSCFGYSFGALEEHTTIFEFRNSKLAPNGSFL